MINGYEELSYSCTSSSSQDVRLDGPVVGKSYNSSNNPSHTLRLGPTQLNSTQLDCRAVWPGL